MLYFFIFQSFIFQTLIKFWRRSKSKSLANASFKLENCVELLDKRIKFLRSTFDEFTNIPSSSNANEMELSVNNEEFIFVYSTGLIDIYKRDASRRFLLLFLLFFPNDFQGELFTY